MDDVHVVAEEGRRQTVGGCVTAGVKRSHGEQRAIVE